MRFLVAPSSHPSVVACDSDHGTSLTLKYSPNAPQDPVLAQYQLIVELLQRIPAPALNSITVVGGQAMLFWALRYVYWKDSPFYLNPSEKIAVTSSDLDFYSTDRKAIEACAKGWLGDVRYPDLEDNTPNTAIVHVPMEGAEPYGIDFLGTLKGLDYRAIEKLLDTFVFNEQELRFLSPPLCLASRIHNYCGLGYGEDKLDREAQRIHLAMRLTRRYLSELLDDFICHGKPNGHARPKVCLGILNYLDQLFVHRDTTNVVMATGVYPPDAIPVDHAGWPLLTRERQIPNIKAKADDHYRRMARHKHSHLKNGQSVPAGMARWLKSPNNVV